MKLLRRLLFLSLVLSSITVFAQVDHLDLFCNAGLHPDGYIDLSSMPVAPNFPEPKLGPPGESAPFTVTLPVTGIAGLTVTITIPGMQSLEAGPIYRVTGGTLQFTSFGAPNGELIMLQFSQPIAGFGLVANSAGRESDFTLQTSAPGSAPANFANSADTLTIAPSFYSIPLQQVDLQDGFTTAFVLFGGNADFATPSISNLRVQSTAASRTASIPKEGLQQWLVSQSVGPFVFGASSWPDQSGSDHPASQTVAANQPGQVRDGNACQPAFSFNGNQYFNFHLPIDGWQQMTIFLVAKSTGDAPPGSAPAAAAALFWKENALWGNTFVTPEQASEGFRFGTTQPGNQLLFSRPVTVGEDFTVTRAVHDGTTDSLYIDGLLALRREDRLPVLSGTTGEGYIGRGLNGTYFQGEISEVMIYNRALSTDEAAIVEAYLRQKFGTR